MLNSLERRQALRIAPPGWPSAQTEDGLPVVPTDLSTLGARLIHTALLYPGSILTLQVSGADERLTRHPPELP